MNKAKWWRRFLIADAAVSVLIMSLAVVLNSSVEATPSGFVAVGMLIFGLTALIGAAIRDVIW